MFFTFIESSWRKQIKGNNVRSKADRSGNFNKSVTWVMTLTSMKFLYVSD